MESAQLRSSAFPATASRKKLSVAQYPHQLIVEIMRNSAS